MLGECYFGIYFSLSISRVGFKQIWPVSNNVEMQNHLALRYSLQQTRRQRHPVPRSLRRPRRITNPFFHPPPPLSKTWLTLERCICAHLFTHMARHETLSPLKCYNQIKLPTSHTWLQTLCARQRECKSRKTPSLAKINK